jgi:Protein of unknown function (DUF2442)
MNTGNGKIAANRPKGLRFESNRLIVTFQDGREVHVPLRLYPSLLRATPAQRSRWRMIGPAKAFHWPDLDLDLSVEGLISGLRQAIPAPPQAKARRTA